MNKNILLILILLSFFNLSHQAGTCRVIAFQDGGDTLAYQAGAFLGITNNLLPEDFQYDVATGVSFGGLNASILAKYKKGDELEAASEIINVWQNMAHTSIFQAYGGGNSYGNLYMPGMFNTFPWRQFIEDLGIYDHQRMLEIGATNVDTAEYDHWNEKVTGEQFNEIFMATTALPTLLPYQSFDGSSYFSGSSVISINPSIGIQRCLNDGFEESEIVVDAIFSTSTQYEAWNEKQRMFDTYRRSYNIQDGAQAAQNYAETVTQYKEVNFRCAIRPSQALKDSNYPFSFNPDDINSMIKLGRDDANTMCNGQNAQKIVREHYTQVLKKAGADHSSESVEKYIKKIESRNQVYKQIKKQKQQLKQQKQTEI